MSDCTFLPPEPIKLGCGDDVSQVHGHPAGPGYETSAEAAMRGYCRVWGIMPAPGQPWVLASRSPQTGPWDHLPIYSPIRLVRYAGDQATNLPPCLTKLSKAERATLANHPLVYVEAAP